jgi:hypothetical protein
MLGRIFGDQSSVACVKAGNRLWLIVGELPIVRQILTIPPKQIDTATGGDKNAEQAQGSQN